MEDIVYWIWLQNVLGIGNNRIKRVLLTYGNAKNLYYSDIEELKSSGFFVPNQIKKLESSETLKEAEGILTKCRELGYDIIAYNDKRYPKRLRNIIDPPCVLYTWGEFPDIDNSIVVGMVGTRQATSYGCESAFKISYDLSKKGVIVVSGGALGIDSESHKGALQAGGKTVAVLGCGINTRYLMKNASLRHAISNQGCVISEYPPDVEAFSWNFPVRNRIISGLSLGVLVVEAGKKSGSLITAGTALDQNRDVFIFEGNTKGALSIGTKNLKNDGAIVINNAEEILNEYEYLAPSIVDLKAGKLKIKKRREVINIEEKNKENKENKEELIKSLSDNEKIVYDILTEEGLSVDDLIMKSGMPGYKVMSLITMLELKKAIGRRSGKIYKLKIK